MPLADPGESQDVLIDRRRRLQRLETALAGLGERCRKIFRWKLEGKGFPTKNVPAAWSHARQGCFKPLETPLPVNQNFLTFTWIRQRQLSDILLRGFSTARFFMTQPHQLHPHDLKAERQQFVQALNMTVLFFENHENLLRQILGHVPPITGCRETGNPFTEPHQYFVACQSFLVYGIGAKHLICRGCAIESERTHTHMHRWWFRVFSPGLLRRRSQRGEPRDHHLSMCLARTYERCFITSMLTHLPL